MSLRLVILSEIIAPYRIPVFNALTRHGAIDLHVIFLAENDPTLRQWPVYADEIRFSYEVLPSLRWRVVGHNVLLNRGLSKALRRAFPDAVLCGGYNYLASWEGMSWARNHGVPFLLWVESTRRDLRRNHAVIESLKKEFIQRCSAFVVAGTSSFEYLTNFGVPQEIIATAPNASDSERFSRRAAEVRTNPVAHRQTLQLPRRYFLSVGRLRAEKGVFDLLESYGRLTPEIRKEIGLVFVGDGAARRELQLRARGIAPGWVQFAGFAQREELAAYYALAETFVFPTHTDPWGLVVNEAMACGLPVIATEAAGCTLDLVQDAWNGRVVCARDVAQLTTAMEELAGNSSLRSRMGEHSRERIQRNSPEACAAGIAGAVLSPGVQSI